MYEMFVYGDGYMICDPLGAQKALIKDGAFAEEVVEALNWQAENDLDKTQEEWDINADAVRDAFVSYKEAVEGDDESEHFKAFNALEMAVEGL